MSALDNPDLARPDRPRAGAVAVANEEAVRAWDTVLYERWKSNRKVFVGALSGVTEQAFELYPPPEQGRCIDIGCGGLGGHFRRSSASGVAMWSPTDAGPAIPRLPNPRAVS